MFSFDNASDNVKTYVLRLRRAKKIETLEIMIERLEADAKSAVERADISTAYCIRELEISNSVG
ncbi:MAG: hypothetical protein ACRDCV_09300 [Plesiomonas shigelloides]